MARKLNRKVVPSDLEREDIKHVDKYPSLVAFLKANNQIQLTTDAQQREAMRLYVIQGLPISQIAKRVNVDKWIVNRWRNVFGWDELRDKRMFRMHQVHAKRLKQFSPNLDKKHDQLFSSIEDMVEGLIEERTVEGGQFTPHELRTMAAAVESCMQSRRTIAGRANKREEHTLAIDETLMPGFMKLLKGAAEEDDAKRKQLGVDLDAAQDAEFAEIEDVIAEDDDDDE